MGAYLGQGNMQHTLADSGHEPGERTLKVESPMLEGDDVRYVQERVRATVDGLYGPETRQRVEEFQEEAGIDVDGIVGPDTWSALEDADPNGSTDLISLPDFMPDGELPMPTDPENNTPQWIWYAAGGALLLGLGMYWYNQSSQ